MLCWQRCRASSRGCTRKLGDRRFRRRGCCALFCYRCSIPCAATPTSSERLLMEQLQYNLLFRWFVGLEIDDPVWNHAVFSKNRDRLLNQELAQRFFAAVKAQAAGLMSDEHFTVDGTLIEAWAGQKSFRRKYDDHAGPRTGADFHGEKRSNQTHESTTDCEARLYKKAAGQE